MPLPQKVGTTLSGNSAQTRDAGGPLHTACDSDVRFLDAHWLVCVWLIGKGCQFSVTALAFLDFLPPVSVTRNVEVIRGGEVTPRDSDLHDHVVVKTPSSPDSPADEVLLSV